MHIEICNGAIKTHAKTSNLSFSTRHLKGKMTIRRECFLNVPQKKMKNSPQHVIVKLWRGKFGLIDVAFIIP
jgi:hypothetical protein